jgi:hypothetical protein
MSLNNSGEFRYGTKREDGKIFCLGVWSNAHTVWGGIKGRCYTPSFQSYAAYGGRGIKVCDRWLESFDNFIEDMGERPTLKHSIERLDVNGDYEPGNCVWATTIQQGINKRNTVYVEVDGVRMRIKDACDLLGIPLKRAFRSIYAGKPFDAKVGKYERGPKIKPPPKRLGRPKKVMAVPLELCKKCNGLHWATDTCPAKRSTATLMEVPRQIDPLPHKAATGEIGHRPPQEREAGTQALPVDTTSRAREPPKAYSNDRHPPGYMASYMRQWRAKQKAAKIALTQNTSVST